MTKLSNFQAWQREHDAEVKRQQEWLAAMQPKPLTPLEMAQKENQALAAAVAKQQAILREQVLTQRDTDGAWTAIKAGPKDGWTKQELDAAINDAGGSKTSSPIRQGFRAIRQGLPERNFVP